MDSVLRHRRTAVKACHSSSKTYTVARLALWWLFRYSDGIVITTASSWTQVERVLWAEIHEALELSRIAFPEANKTELALGPKNYIIGLSTNQAARFRGFHSGHVLLIFDEAPGIRGEIWEELPGIMAGGHVRIIALGNPVVPGGPFHDAFTLLRDSWNTITISAFDTPNLKPITKKPGSVQTKIHRLERWRERGFGEPERPYLCSPEWILENYEAWGLDNPRFQARVLGEFPDQAEEALVSLKWLEDAKYREPEPEDKRKQVRVGIDVAGGGESETVVYVIQDINVVGMGAFSQTDARGAVLNFLRPWEKRIEVANVDIVGMGRYFMPHLEDNGIACQGINVGEAALDSKTFANLRAELCYGLRDRFEEGEIAGVTDERTLAQASTVLKTYTPTGKNAIESKDAARARGVKSPDRWEALMLAFAPKISRKKHKVKHLRWGRKRGRQ